jgi:CheY-like chemotaxis protein
MPHMTGLKMLGEIQKMRPSVPVVLATGYAEIDDGDLTVARLSKPFTQAQLAQIIAQVMPADLAEGRIIRFRSHNGNGGGR